MNIKEFIKKIRLKYPYSSTSEIFDAILESRKPLVTGGNNIKKYLNEKGITFSKQMVNKKLHVAGIEPVTTLENNKTTKVFKIEGNEIIKLFL
jgi:hypothetical protein